MVASLVLFGLRAAVYPIYAVILLDVLGFTFLIPLLPALAAKLHASDAVMGLALSVTALCAALSSTPWGVLSDRIGRKGVLQCSQLCSLCGYALLALTSSLPLLFAARAIEGLGGGNLGVAQSYVADLTADRDRPRAYACGSAAFGLGFVAGPILAGQLYRFGLAVPFWTAAGLQLANLALTGTLVERASVPARRVPGRGALARELGVPAMRVLMARQFLYIFSFTYLFTIFGLYLYRELDAGPETSSRLLALAGAIGAVVQVFVVARIAERIGNARLAQLGFALAFVAYVALTLVDGRLGTFVAVLAVWAVSGAILQPALTTLIARAASNERRGAVLGFADSLNNLAMIVAPAAGGAILASAPRAVGVAPALAVAAAFILGMRRSGEHCQK